MRITNPWLLLATFFGLGKIPWAPGTWGSGVGVLLYWATGDLPLWGQLLFFALLTLLGTLASHRVALALGRKDPSCVIIDEVAGAYLALLGHPADPLHLVAGFLLFRILDIWKPWPIRITERLTGGLGIMADDLTAGGMANLLLFLPQIL
ncbi:phosphatidylglycerophosphatase A family protein [Thermosulfurimonas dismutans]|uniref:Phosphatidylglycerophosphatase A n=1 Tax=Thermosulfurimonas dismutans TaxID=999894 RepID=A0A179D3E3_9BACT|nr:phosphatidylglycerophosphatase A [Thermosulfurimonas dismutans]OAQ20503.1 Phosphatidylglycerophosphatase A [Thermosulfurimonas dismutans]